MMALVSFLLTLVWLTFIDPLWNYWEFDIEIAIKEYDESSWIFGASLISVCTFAFPFFAWWKHDGDVAKVDRSMIEFAFLLLWIPILVLIPRLTDFGGAGGASLTIGWKLFPILVLHFFCARWIGRQLCRAGTDGLNDK